MLMLIARLGLAPELIIFNQLNIRRSARLDFPPWGWSYAANPLAIYSGNKLCLLLWVGIINLAWQSAMLIAVGIINLAWQSAMLIAVSIAKSKF
jgi:hypothetical protein